MKIKKRIMAAMFAAVISCSGIPVFGAVDSETVSEYPLDAIPKSNFNDQHFVDYLDSITIFTDLTVDLRIAWSRNP